MRSFASFAGSACTAYRTSLGADGNDLPESIGNLVTAVTAFADPLVDPERNNATWRATDRRWTP